MSRSFARVLVLSLAFSACSAAAETARMDVIGFPEFPSVSPDGSLIVYMWAGDLWAVPREGGVASRLTSHPADERASAFNPDGTMLAFESDRHGARNIYMMPISRQGNAILAGEMTRITRSDRAQSLSGFSSDGSKVLFSGMIEPSIYRHERMYAAPIAGGPVERLTDAFGGSPQMSHDGSHLVFTRGRCEWERPAYRGTGERQVWLHRFDDGTFHELTTWDGNDGDAFFLPDGAIVFVSSRDGQNNLYRLARGASDPGTPVGPGLTQLTRFKPAEGELSIGHGIRDLCVSRDGSTAVFCVWDSLYTLDLRTPGAAPRPVEIRATPDVNRSDTERITLDRLITEAAISPDGKAIAVIARGEVFVRSTETDRPTRRVTYTAGRERDLVWSPDGRSLYFVSDESGTLGIYEARVALALEDIVPLKANAVSETQGTAGQESPVVEPIAEPGHDLIVGTWSCTASGAPPIPPAGLAFVLTITRSDAGYAANVSAPPMFDGAAQDVQFDPAAKVLTFSVSVSADEVAVFRLEVANGTIGGTATIGAASAAINGRKADVVSLDIVEIDAGSSEEFAMVTEYTWPSTGYAFSAATDPVTGTWDCKATGPAPLPEEGVDFVLRLKLNGQSVTGELIAPNWYQGALTGASWDAESRRLSGMLTTPAGPGSLAVEVTEAGLEGTVTVADMVFQVRGARRPEPTPQALARATDSRPAERQTPRQAESKPKIDYGKRWAESLRYEVRPLIDTPAQEYGPTPSPDGRHMLYIRDHGDLILVSMKDGSERVVMPGWNAPSVQWAGDSRHIVYEVSDLDFNSDIWLLDVLDADAAPVNLTRHPDLDRAPRLSADGRVLAFVSDRAGNNFEFSVYAVFLDKSLEGLTNYELADHFKKAADEARKTRPIEPVDFEAEYTPPKPLTFDVEDAHLRVRRLTNMPGSQSNLAMTPGGDRILFTGTVDGSFGFYSIDYKGEDRKSITSGGVSDVRVNAKGDMVSFVASGQARSAGPAGGRSENYPIRASIVIDIASQQRQKFLEMARILEIQFYHPTLKGLNWRGLTARYVSLAEKTRDSNGFNRVGRIMMGELNGSHLGISGGGSPFSAPSEGYGYLGVAVSPVPGGYRVESVLPGSPAYFRHSRLQPGDVLLGVNAVRFAPDEASLPTVDLVAAMAATNGEQVLLELRRELEPTRNYLLITPTGYGTIVNLAYEHEVQQRRELVEKLSDGRIGYLHIRGMSQPSVRDFERDLYAAAHGKDGLLIDVRDNGGGSTADILLASLTAPVHAYTVPRGANQADAAPASYPRDRRLIHPYQRPISVLINQNSFSNAEIFAHAIKTIGRGKLVGTATFGGVISTGSASLIDGSTVRTPFRGWYLPDGTDMENNGARPDLDVPQLPQDEVAGRDLQIEAAVKELLERISATPDGIWRPGQ